MAVRLFTYAPPLLSRLRPPAFVPPLFPAALCGGIEKRVGCRATGAVPPSCLRKRRPPHRRATDRLRPSTICATRDTPLHTPQHPRPANGAAASWPGLVASPLTSFPHRAPSDADPPQPHLQHPKGLGHERRRPQSPSKAVSCTPTSLVGSGQRSPGGN